MMDHNYKHTALSHIIIIEREKRTFDNDNELQINVDVYEAQQNLT